MTRIAKLNARFLSGAPLSFEEFQTVLRAYGFFLDRIGGSHHVYRHPAIARPFPITPDGSAARRYQLRAVRDIIKTFGLRMDET